MTSAGARNRNRALGEEEEEEAWTEEIFHAASKHSPTYLPTYYIQRCNEMKECHACRFSRSWEICGLTCIRGTGMSERVSAASQMYCMCILSSVVDSG